ncbi:MAG: hypothetical protein U0744_15105 [Gemmataceae bacterium]
MTTRREFLSDVGAGVVSASLGVHLAADLGFSTAFADQGSERVAFGSLEPLVAWMQETPADRLITQCVERWRSGTSLRDIAAAAAFANARTFGGEDYVGFHTLMAIGPAYHMAQEMPEASRPLPLLKVIYRNADRIRQFGGVSREVLRPVQPAALPNDRSGAEALRDRLREPNVGEAERTFAAIGGTPLDSLNALLMAVEDAAEVHRVVLPYRAWDLMGIIGREHAHALLRQSVRYCAKAETPGYRQYMGDVRTLIPRLLDQHRLIGRELGTRRPDDRWVEDLSLAIFRGTPAQAADATASALAEGFDPAAIGEAISLAANELVLRDNGRPKEEGPNKPQGSVHGDSVGVHGCDSANAWRNLTRIGDARNKVVCLLLGAWQVARDRGDRGGDFLNQQPYPREEAREAVRTVEPARTLEL